MIHSVFQPVLHFFSAEKRSAGLVRLGIVIFILVGITLWSASAFSPPDRFPWIIFTLQGIKYWILPLAGFLAALVLAGNYARDLYDLESLRSGMRYVLSTTFARSLPSLKIDRVDVDLDPKQGNQLARIGGPGYLNILPGYLALLENSSGPSNVYSAGIHYVSRREFVKEIASLEDQHGYIETASATTKDGILVIVREIRYHYRLRPSRRQGEYIPRSPVTPFPYTLQSMRNYTYSRYVSHVGLTSMPIALDFIVNGAITDYINTHRFDDLTSPGWDTQPHPRTQIWNDLTTRESFRERFRAYGIELLWVDIGHFDVDNEDIWKWRVQTWGAHWQGVASLPRGLGQVRRQTYEKIARAEGRADALSLLIDNLNDARLQGLPAENLRSLVLLYTAQILDELGKNADEHHRPNALPPQPDL